MSTIGSGPGPVSGSQFESATTRVVGGANSATPAPAAAIPAVSAPAAVAGTVSATAPGVVVTSAGAGTPAVDSDRVATIKAALAKGAYPIIPTKIGDAMIAAGLLLRTTS